MPTTQEHRARAAQNLRFAQSFNLDTTPYLDWVVTAYFYAALHLVDALLFYRDRLDPGCHPLRKEYVRKKSYLQEINLQYRELKDRSEDARYNLLTFSRTKIEKDVIPLYLKIEKHITQQLP